MSSWGYWDAAPARPTTVRHERLTVFEPGLPASRRWALHLLRNAGVAAGFVGVVTIVVFGLPGGIAITAAFIAVCVFVARRLRGHTRSLLATVPAGRSTAESEVIGELRRHLTRLDRDRRAGLLTPVEWEAACWSVYDRMREPGPVLPRR